MIKSALMMWPSCGVTHSESAVSFYLEPAAPFWFPCRLLQQEVQEFHNLCQSSPIRILLPNFPFGQVSQYECSLRFQCYFVARWHLTYLLFKGYISKVLQSLMTSVVLTAATSSCSTHIPQNISNSCFYTVVIDENSCVFFQVPGNSLGQEGCETC